MTVRVHPLASLIAAFGRGVSGVQVRWLGCRPSTAQRIYFANHTSHLDFVVLWSSLPRETRAQTRPVAAMDYWSRGIRAYLAQRVFRAVLIQRGLPAHAGFHYDALAGAQTRIEALAAAMGSDDSLILFPEGTRGTGETIAPFRSGIYYLSQRRPDVELVPAYLENLSRILPKGEFLPVPLLCTLTFGAPIRVEDREAKHVFLERARQAVLALRRKGEAA
jgi:1-acyl-sn-glycerol-3-phosphate acyltransferase